MRKAAPAQLEADHPFVWFLVAVLVIVLLIAAGVPAQAASSTLVVSEVVYDASGSEPDGEWIEIYNLSGSTIDLSNYKVGDEETSGGGEGMQQFPGGASIAAGNVVVVANRATAFAAAHGFNPDYEINDSDGNVPDMVHYGTWAGGSVALSNSSDEVLILDGNDALVDAVSWGSSTFAFDPPAPDVSQGHSLERNPADVDSDSADDWIDQSTPAPGSVVTTDNTTPTPTPTASPTSDPDCSKSDTYLATWEIQGSGHTSPYDGQSVNNVRGIVTVDFQNGTGGPFEPWGFFIQAHETDCDAATSDGLFVYTGSSAKNIGVGDLVEVDGGSVLEYQGPSSFIWDLTLTELQCSGGCSVSTLQNNYGLPTVQEYDPPTDDTNALAYNESREGMLMQVTTDSTVIAPNNTFNEFVMLRGTGLDRLHRDDGDTGHRIVVDGDGVAAEHCGQDGFDDIKSFDTILYDPANGSAVYGPLNYNFNTYKVQQDDDTHCVGFNAGDDSSYDPADNPPPSADADVFTISSLNALNLFDTDDDPQKSDPVASQSEYDLKIAKRAAAVCNANGLNQPLIIGLQEVENDVVLQALVDEISATCGVTYDLHTLAGPDDRSIEVGFLTRADRVTVVAADDRQGCSSTDWGVDYESNDHPADVNCSGSTPHYLFNRPPLHLEAQITLGGSQRTLHVINNHFKSKLSSSACSISDCTDRRIEQAQHVDDLVDNILAANSSANVIVMGDLNDFYNSDPLDVLDNTNGVLTNVWDDLNGPPSSGQGTITRYSYIFNGVSQTLDHMLVSDAINALSRTVSPRHLNADWPGSHESDTTMFRSSDHDFLLVGFDFSGGTEPTPTPTPENTPTPTPTPEDTPTPTPTPQDTPTPTPTSTATPENTPTPTATPTGSDTMHVGDLDGNSTNQGSTWTAIVDVLIVDGSGNPVTDAAVGGTWSGGASGADSCLTDGSGWCTVSVGNIHKRNSTTTFTVDDVSHASLTYDSTANTDPDGDSDGTSITVSKP